jgi:hypothetical protein
MDNPNEYDDNAFMEASNELQGNLTEMLNQLWEAGAQLSDIEAEIAIAIDNADFAPSGSASKVDIFIATP